MNSELHYITRITTVPASIPRKVAMEDFQPFIWVLANKCSMIIIYFTILGNFQLRILPSYIIYKIGHWVIFCRTNVPNAASKLTKHSDKGGAAVAQWVRLRLQSCRPPGSNPKHTIYAFINLNLNYDMLKRRK